MTWTPLPRATLDAMIAAALADAGDDARARWAQLRIEPEKWRWHPEGDEGGGFWAIAVDRDRVLWFNDIEDGFTWSRFAEHGALAEYGGNQASLAEALAELANPAAAPEPTAVTELPAELTGPGTISARQTTYWQLDTAGGARYRIHARDKVEMRFAGVDYPHATLTTAHPILVRHHEASRSLYVAGAARDPAGLAGEIDRVIAALSMGWRGLDDFAGGVAATAKVLRTGHGLLMQAPTSVCDAVATVLEVAGLRPSSVAGAPGDTTTRALVLGGSFVVAPSFAIEPRPPGR